MKLQAFKTKGCRSTNDRWPAPATGALLALMYGAPAVKGSRNKE
jgi:hypothetical protein